MPSSLFRGQTPSGIRPVIGGGTGGADAATARTNLSVHTEAEHATFHLDDSLILSGRYTVLETETLRLAGAASAISTLQTALNAYDTVFVRRTGSGYIDFANTNYSITIPTQTALVGIGYGGNLSDQWNYAPYIFQYGTSQRFYLYEGSIFRNFGFDLSNPSGPNSTSLITCQGSGAPRLVSHVRVDYSNGGNRNHPVVEAGSGTAVRIEACSAWAIPTTYSNQAIFQASGVATNEGAYPCGIFYSSVYGQNTTKTTNGMGFRCYYGHIIGCKAYRTGDHGFYFLPASNFCPSIIMGNIAYDCNGSGFFQGSSTGDTAWLNFSGNRAILSGDHGVYLPYNRTTYYGVISHGNYSAGSNQNASGSANYIFGSHVLNDGNF